MLKYSLCSFFTIPLTVLRISLHLVFCFKRDKSRDFQIKHFVLHFKGLTVDRQSNLSSWVCQSVNDRLHNVLSWFFCIKMGYCKMKWVRMWKNCSLQKLEDKKIVDFRIYAHESHNIRCKSKFSRHG